MFRPRIIPVLLLHNLGLVKSINFKNHRYIGDPINAVKIFNDSKADELVFLDIDATREHRLISLDFVREVGEEANMPFAVGGGVRSIDDIRSILASGAEKVVIGTYATENPDFIREVSDTFGASTTMVCIDFKCTLWGTKKVCVKNGKTITNFLPVEFAKLMEKNGAGELIIQSVERDGKLNGYDLQLIEEISRSVTIPVIALGGAGSLQHMYQAYNSAYASGLAAGSLFVYQGQNSGVLINYPSPNHIQELFKK